MSIAIDTNIVVYILAGNAEYSGSAKLALQDAARTGQRLAISPPVYAELLAIPSIGKESIDEFLSDANILVDWIIRDQCWIEAGTAYAAYARRRKRQKIDAPRRILADFIIGAHATQIGALLTADAKFYRTNFPELRVLAP